MGLVIALVVAVPLALWSAHHEGGVIDRVISAATFGVLSVPSFLAGLLLIMVTVNWLGWFPRSQWVRIGDSLSGNLSHAILPAITISLLEMAMFTRVLRSDLVTTLREDYILASKSKGIPTLRVLFSDALRPSSFSLIPMMGLGLDGIIGSAQSRWLHFGVVSVAPIVSPSCTPVPSWKRRRPKSCSLVLTTRTP